MLAFKFVVLLVLFALNAVGPGLCILRKLRWSPGEKFCASIGLSQFVVFLIAFALYCMRADAGWYWLIFVVGAISTYVVRGELRTLWKNHNVRAQIRTFLILLPIGLCMMALIREYSGGSWAGDWLEHFQRTKFFLEHHRYDEIFIERYTLPARPPMMNILAAVYMAQIGDNSYAIFQLSFLLLNLLVVLPCVLLLPVVGAKHRRFSLAALTFLLAASPMFLQNLTWTWPRLLTTCYALIGVWFYLRGWWKNDSVRMTAAFVALAIGALVHYSIGPYIVVLLAHYAVLFLVPRVMTLFRAPPSGTKFPLRSWREPLFAGAISLAVLSTWFGWSLVIYGRQITFGANTTVTDTTKFTFKENTIKFFDNCYYSIVPHPLALPKGMFWNNFVQESMLGYIRDYTFTLYQQNMLFNLGSIGWILVIILLVRLLIARKEVTLDRKIFWWCFIVATTLLGILAVGSLEVLGVAHACLQPMMLLAIVFFAGEVRWFYRWVRVILLIACILDFAIGIYLHATLEHRTYFLAPDPMNRPNVVAIGGGGGLNQRAFIAWNAKTYRKLYFIGDEFDRSMVVVQILFAEWFALIAYQFWSVCIVDRRRAAWRDRQSWRDLLPRTPLTGGTLG